MENKPAFIHDYEKQIWRVYQEIHGQLMWAVFFSIGGLKVRHVTI